MKAVRETIRKYYKYIVTRWTQPVITNNGTMGSSSFACYPKGGGSGYAAFDGNTSSYWYHYAQSDHLKWISFYSAAPLKISSLHLIFDNVNNTDLFYSHPSTYLFANVNNGNGWNTNAAGYNSGNPNSNWVRLGSVGSTGSAEYDLICTENEGYYNYFQLIVNLANYVDNHDGIALKECQITADYIDSVETTIDDYDFYEDTYKYSLPVEIERKYYKYDTANPVYNIDTVGTINNNNGILSGFSANNYVTLPSTFNPNNNTWEICLKTKLTSTASNKCLFVGGQQGGGLWSILIYTNNNQMQLSLSSNGSSWNIWNGAKVFDITVNIDYWVKIEFDGSTYSAKHSTDGENYTTISTLNSSAVIYPNTKTYLGSNQGLTNYTFDGEIDLNESYIKINNKIWWEGVTYPVIEGNEQDYDFYKDRNIYYAIKSYKKGQYYGN